LIPRDVLVKIEAEHCLKNLIGESKKMVKHVVILAGGSGTRLWPASRTTLPKQFLNLRGGKSLFQETIERASALRTEGMIIVVTHKDHMGQIISQWNALSPKESPQRRVVLSEPVACNTAPAIAYAASLLRTVGDATESFIVLASDHLIEPIENFRNDVDKASRLAQDGFLVTFGIPPRDPETGYGYIETGEEQPPGYRVMRFHEKPNLATAVRYVEMGNFYWNSGMFTFRTDVFFQELRRHEPGVAEPFDAISLEMAQKESVLVPRDPDKVRSVYERLPSISIDYALMERSSNASMVKTTFDWSDIGSWDEVSRYFSAANTEALEVEAEGNFVYSDIPVALAGVNDLIVVVKNGVALVCKKGSSQLVRNVVEEVKRKKKELL
jgi:mannose-1-phosphate guanylyltransferase/mannose-6-phosphate isomerase